MKAHYSRLVLAVLRTTEGHLMREGGEFEGAIRLFCLSMCVP